MAATVQSKEASSFPKDEPQSSRPVPKPLEEGKQGGGAIVALWILVIAPFVAGAGVVALLAVYGWFSWLDLVILAVGYVIAGLGGTMGLHRYFTHGSFKAKRPLRIALAIAGSMAVEGRVDQWVADHRRHHQYTDREGDPHSPWRFGTTAWAVAKGLVYAHVGWLFKRDMTNRKRFAPDLLADRDISRISNWFGPIAIASFVLPTLIGFAVSGTWQGALSALLWGGFIRVGLLHHVTWAINSVCHVYGERPFKAPDGDKATNFWPLAILSFGESWHNLHHADPTSARHGVLPGQIDITARAIWLCEKLGWVSNVKWPQPERLETKRIRV